MMQVLRSASRPVDWPAPPWVEGFSVREVLGAITLVVKAWKAFRDDEAGAGDLGPAERDMRSLLVRLAQFAPRHELLMQLAPWLRHDPAYAAKRVVRFVSHRVSMLKLTSSRGNS
jgi:hypothetical protein